MNERIARGCSVVSPWLVAGSGSSCRLPVSGCGAEGRSSSSEAARLWLPRPGLSVAGSGLAAGGSASRSGSVSLRSSLSSLGGGLSVALSSISESIK